MIRNRTLPDGRVSLEPSSTVWRFKRERPFLGKLWSGLRYKSQPPHVCYTDADITRQWLHAGRDEPIEHLIH